MSYQRKHRYCGGKGFIRLASGADGHCFGCKGTGMQTVYTVAERSAKRAKRERWEDARKLVGTQARRMSPPPGVPALVFRLDVVAGFDSLGEQEPERMEKLYASLDAGRADDVVRALYAYRVTMRSEGECCIRCGKGDLPRGWMCDRGGVVSGLCLRCCPHNHG